MKGKYICCAVVLLLAIGLPHTLMAQSCALCYSQAAGAGSKFIQGLRSGILILIFPPLAISICVTGLTWKRRNQFNSQREGDEPTPSSPSSLGW